MRVSFAGNGAGGLQLKDNNDYYPFGMNHLKTGSSYFGAGSYVKYKFGGKELQEFGAYDFGARIYMADIGRWFATDPMAEANPSLTTYRYGFNSPIMFTDPNGMLEQAQINHMWNNSGNGGSTSWSFNTDGSPKKGTFSPIDDPDMDKLLTAFNGVASGGGSTTISYFTGTATQTSYLRGGEIYGDGNIGVLNRIKIENNNDISWDSYKNWADHGSGTMETMYKVIVEQRTNLYRNGYWIDNLGIQRSIRYAGRARGSSIGLRSDYLRTTARFSKYADRIGWVGYAINAAEVGYGVYEDKWRFGKNAQVATAEATTGLIISAGVASGTTWLTGAIAGAVGGSVAPGIGTAIGFVVGAIAGYYAGNYAGEIVEDMYK